VLAADSLNVTPRLPATAFRLVVLVAVWVLGTSTLSLAQEDPPAPAGQPVAPEAVESYEDSNVLLVPDVQGLPYVFAKGVLEDFGFAWKIEGKVEGYAVNLVAEQSVEPAAKVLDTGAPTIVLRLKKNPNYEAKGLPEDGSPYPGTKVVLVTAEDLQPAPAEEAEGTGSESAPEQESTENAPPENEGATEPAETEPAAAAYEEASNTIGGTEGSAEVEQRTPAFDLPGAPAEPLDEISLPERAEQLADWVADLDKLTPASLDHFTYQHAWVVTGAEFGWWHGAEALTIVIEADEQLQSKFGAGKKYEAIARAALDEVRQKTKAAA
jgi:hypothetical protein